MENTGIGEMQMCPDSFWHRCSFADFQRKAFYFYRNKNSEFKDRWEQVRKVSHILALVNGAKVKAVDVMPFPWDSESGAETPEAKPITKSEVSRILKQFNIKQN